MRPWNQRDDDAIEVLDLILDALGDCRGSVVCPGCGRTVRCDQPAGHATDHHAPPCPVTS